MKFLETTIASLPYPLLIVEATIIVGAVLFGALASSLVRRFLMPRFASHEPGGFASRWAKLTRAAVAAIIIAASRQSRTIGNCS